MRTKLPVKTIGLLAAVSLSACVSTGPAVKNADVPADMASTYAQKARWLEQNGDIVQAARYYKLARTVSPDDPAVARDLARIDSSRRQMANVYYRRGIELYALGKYADSRRALLTALRLQPDHAGALEKLKSRTRIAAKRFILHRVKPGESISTIAGIYYGDPGRYAVIAQFNKLPDATRIRLGQVLKIPEIEGLPFNVDRDVQPIRTEAADPPPLAAWPAGQSDSYEEPAGEASVASQVAGYQAAGLDFLREKKYDAAIAEFNKVLSAQPRNRDVRGHMYRAHYAWAQDLMREKKYISAKRQFEKCLALNSDCQRCHGLIRECESAFKEMHYQRGIQFFGAEKPEEAIAEWERVRELDPDYKQVDQYVKKARTISRKIKLLRQQTD